ncbi:hypothetical protein LZ31DRAFT_48205 [Colletotrichum somersetense]|nr:hypothetical protein LZ31DRAFT_48205 [Colletotrichum somersetense]
MWLSGLGFGDLHTLSTIIFFLPFFLLFFSCFSFSFVPIKEGGEGEGMDSRNALPNCKSPVLRVCLYMPLPSHGRLVSVAPPTTYVSGSQARQAVEQSPSIRAVLRHSPFPLPLSISLHPCEDIHKPSSPVSLQQYGMVGNTMSNLLPPPPPPPRRVGVTEGQGIGDSLASVSEKKRQGGCQVGTKRAKPCHETDRRTRCVTAYTSSEGPDGGAETMTPLVLSVSLRALGPSGRGGRSRRPKPPRRRRLLPPTVHVTSSRRGPCCAVRPSVRQRHGVGGGE